MLSPTIKPKRTKSPEQALASLMRLCARSEKAEADARRLLYGWGVAAADAEQIVVRLVRERFIDDNRYAAAFVREKLKLSGWGAYKIRATLQRKSIAKEIIDEALTQVEPAKITSRLTELLARKVRTVKHETPYELKTKLIRYGLSLGHDYEAVLDAASQLTKDTDLCDDFQ